MHEKLLMATCACVLAICKYSSLLNKQRRKRKSNEMCRCGKKRRYDSEVELSDDEIEQPSNTDDSQTNDVASNQTVSSDKNTTDEDDSDEDNSDGNQADILHNKAMDTLNRVLEFVDKENEKERNQDTCSTYLKLLEYKLRRLTSADQSYLMYEIDKLYLQFQRQRMAEEDNIVPDLGLVEERPDDDHQP